MDEKKFDLKVFGPNWKSVHGKYHYKYVQAWGDTYFSKVDLLTAPNETPCAFQEKDTMEFFMVLARDIRSTDFGNVCKIRIGANFTGIGWQGYYDLDLIAMTIRYVRYDGKRIFTNTIETVL